MENLFNSLSDISKSILYSKHTTRSGEDLIQRHTRLLRDYSDALINLGFGVTKSELHNYDRIDVQNLTVFEEPNTLRFYLKNIQDFESFNDELLHKMVRESTWLNFIPPFEKGVYYFGNMLYMQFEVTNVDLSERSFSFILHLYNRAHNYWDVGPYMEDTAHFGSFFNNGDILDDSFHNMVRHDIRNGLTYVNIYNIIPTKEMTSWSKGDREYWKQVIQRNAEVSLSAIGSETYFKGLIDTFFRVTILVNYLMYVNKISTQRNKSGRKPKTKVQTVYTQQTTATKHTHIVGDNLIKVSSKKKPRAASESYIRHYSCATWKVQAHPRHYKSGKVVWIKEQERKRKGLSQSQDTPREIVIKA